MKKGKDIKMPITMIYYDRMKSGKLAPDSTLVYMNKCYEYDIAKYSNKKLPETFYSSNITSASYGHDVVKYLYKHQKDKENLLFKKIFYDIL